jgi:predicted nucleotidyltransferase
MGTKQTSPRPSIATALFSEVQGRVLGLLFGRPERRFHGAEVIRLVARGTGATHRVLRELARADLLTVSAVGNQRHYQANAASPVFDDLRRLVLKSIALNEPIAKALAPLADRIDEAFVFGSTAKGSDRARSDVDLLVISETVEYAELLEALSTAESDIGRRIEPVIVTRAAWEEKRRASDSFASRVMSGERITVIAKQNDAD